MNYILDEVVNNTGENVIFDLFYGESSSLGNIYVETPASYLANKIKILSCSRRPNTVAVVKTVDGKFFIGYNKAGVYSREIQGILDALGNVNIYNRQCAEINAISNAMNAGCDMTGAQISVAHVRGLNDKSGMTGTHKKPCDVCQPLLDYLKIDVIY